MGGKAKPIFQCQTCPKCNLKGHSEKECWGQCKICKGWGHKYCRQRPELVEEVKAIIPKKPEKKKGRKRKAKKAQETNDLPEEEVEDFSEESSKVESPIQQRVRRVQSLRDQNVNFLEGETSDSVRRIHTAEYTDSEVGQVVSSIKAAKASKIMCKVNSLKL